MKRNLLQIGLTILLSSSLFGFTYEIKDGWQQVGAIQDIDDLSIFNNAGCVDHVWYYDNTNTADPQWKLHIANGNTYNYCGETLTSLKKGQGFWVKATGECTITIDEPVCPTSNMPAPPDLENGTCDTNTTTPDNTVLGNLDIWASVATTNGEFCESAHIGGGLYRWVTNLREDAFNITDENYTIKIIWPDGFYLEMKGGDRDSDFTYYNKININGTVYDVLNDAAVISHLTPYISTHITTDTDYFRPIGGRESLKLELTGIEIN